MQRFGRQTCVVQLIAAQLALQTRIINYAVLPARVFFLLPQVAHAFGVRTTWGGHNSDSLAFAGARATPGARRTAAYNITTLLICSLQKDGVPKRRFLTTPLAPARFFRAPLSSQRLPEHLAFVQSAFWQRGAPGRALRGGDDSGSSSSEDAGAGAFRCGGSSGSEDVGAAGAGAGAVVDAGTALL